jgi:hypothetical protein
VAARLSRRLRLLAGTSALLAGCSFLVDFVEKATPGVLDAGGALEASATPPADAADDPGREAAMPPGDAAIDRPITRDGSGVGEAECANPCRQRENGWYCGNDMLACLAPSNDLYRCMADAVADVTVCVNGAGCLYLPLGHPDTCDPCSGRADGRYCGHEFVGAVPQTPADQNANYLFVCNGGRAQLASKPCPGLCATGAPGNATCT